MTKAFIVTAQHVSPVYRLDAVRFLLNTRAEGSGLVCHRAAHAEYGIAEEYWASLKTFGCGKSRATPESAIRTLLESNGCTGITITEEAPAEANPFDALARAMMSCRPNLRQDMSLDEWIVQHSDDLTGPEERAARAILYLHLNQG